MTWPDNGSIVLWSYGLAYYLLFASLLPFWSRGDILVFAKIFVDITSLPSRPPLFQT